MNVFVAEEVNVGVYVKVTVEVYVEVGVTVAITALDDAGVLVGGFGVFVEVGMAVVYDA